MASTVPVFTEATTVDRARDRKTAETSFENACCVGEAGAVVVPIRTAPPRATATRRVPIGTGKQSSFGAARRLLKRSAGYSLAALEQLPPKSTTLGHGLAAKQPGKRPRNVAKESRLNASRPPDASFAPTPNHGDDSTTTRRGQLSFAPWRIHSITVFNSADDNGGPSGGISRFL